ncbi:MAG: sel1 repeat family protein [Bacteroidetes bacterium]|nr:sel1 repeat family protein [Bacteroidota bacterium]
MNGDGVIQSNKEAIRWFQLAARQGHPEAKNEFNKLFENKNENESVYDMGWIIPENANRAKAEYQIACYYYWGKGAIKKSYSQAAFWMKSSAEKGSDEAQNHLGVMYLLGLGVKQDYSKSMHWFLTSAANGNCDAQYNIGLTYLAGLGVKKDIKTAKEWLKKACQNGSNDACKAYKDISK